MYRPGYITITRATIHSRQKNISIRNSSNTGFVIIFILRNVILNYPSMDDFPSILTSYIFLSWSNSPDVCIWIIGNTTVLFIVLEMFNLKSLITIIIVNLSWLKLYLLLTKRVRQYQLNSLVPAIFVNSSLPGNEFS